jgi:hypothetical protein
LFPSWLFFGFDTIQQANIEFLDQILKMDEWVKDIILFCHQNTQPHPNLLWVYFFRGLMIRRFGGNHPLFFTLNPLELSWF